MAPTCRVVPFVRLIWYDDHSQISFARKKVFQLLREDKIDILLGPYSSSLTMVYSGRGTFGWRVARGILESALVWFGHRARCGGFLRR
jgi:hypothetical protein